MPLWSVDWWCYASGPVLGQCVPVASSRKLQGWPAIDPTGRGGEVALEEQGGSSGPGGAGTGAVGSCTGGAPLGQGCKGSSRRAGEQKGTRAGDQKSRRAGGYGGVYVLEAGGRRAGE